ncbi:MAG TPA: hypothetical protein VFA08_13655 [Actinomycetota bacterium]|nr:hypothetical protein [Actinomycetota bacterium]
MKLVVLVTEPPGVVTLIGPVVAVAGTVAVICVFEFTVNVVAATLLNVTAVAPVKFVPVILTDVPTAPNVGANEVIVGAAIVKLVRLDPVPPGVVTLIGPLVAVVGTVAVICVAEFTVNVVAATLLNVTEVAPVKFVPVMVTDVPTGPDVGVNDVIVGQVVLATVKVGPESVPSAFVTSTAPVVVPVPTTAVIDVPESILNDAALVLLNSTSVTLGLLKFVPVMVTTHPTGPLVGEIFVMVGAAANAGVSRPSTSNAVATPTAATRRPMRRLTNLMVYPHLPLEVVRTLHTSPGESTFPTPRIGLLLPSPEQEDEVELVTAKQEETAPRRGPFLLCEPLGERLVAVPHAR